MQTDIDPRDLIGHKAVDRNGDKIGTVDEVYLDDATGEPEWAAVRTGIFGRDAFVPLTTSEFSGEELRVPYDKSLIKESPDFGVGQHLSPAQELQLYRYYGLDTVGVQPQPSTTVGAPAAERDRDRDFGTVTTATPTATTTAATTADPGARSATTPHQTTTSDRTHQTRESAMPLAFTTTPESAAPAGLRDEPQTHVRPGPAPDLRTGTGAPTVETAPHDPVEITCREERMDITTEWHVLGTAKLRKYVTTESVERRVPVVRERVRIERVPVTEAERAALTEQEIAEAVEEVTLREERPVVHKYLAPVERVRLVVERYTEELVVHEELRREQVEIHDSTSAEEPTAGPGPLANGSGRPEPMRPS
ncbi:PRC and DUF2382 domain-containing protein [Kitasatospora camelliae]|uniref:PRC and DUF2382 domain-containing protein n=1 Tax=Kitasatospora camelliae TaxID=3156397 RepID=A0AAU8JSA8_9ACTN